MFLSKRVVCVLPAYNAARTLEKTLQEVPRGIVDKFILVDDVSRDETVKVAETLKDQFPLEVIRHEEITPFLASAIDTVNSNVFGSLTAKSDRFFLSIFIFALDIALINVE